MQRTVKFISEASDAVCRENLPGCDVKSGIVHVLFEDGAGVATCRNCFEKHVDEGLWVTDSSISLRAA